MTALKNINDIIIDIIKQGIDEEELCNKIISKFNSDEVQSKNTRKIYCKGQLIGEYRVIDLEKVPFLKELLECEGEIDLNLPPKFLTLLMDNILNELGLKNLHIILLENGFPINNILRHLNYLGMESTNKKLITEIYNYNKAVEINNEKVFTVLTNPEDYLVILSLDHAAINIDGKKVIGQRCHKGFCNCFSEENSITFGNFVFIPVKSYIEREKENYEVLEEIFKLY